MYFKKRNSKKLKNYTLKNFFILIFQEGACNLFVKRQLFKNHHKIKKYVILSLKKKQSFLN